MDLGCGGGQSDHGDVFETTTELLLKKLRRCPWTFLGLGRTRSSLAALFFSIPVLSICMYTDPSRVMLIVLLEIDTYE